MSLYKGSTLIAGGRQSMPLLSFMWADHQLNDMSWLRADTFSWQSGSVYKAAYQHLVKDICAQYWGTNPDGTGLVVFTKALEEISIGSSVYDTDLTTVLGTITAIDTVNNTITVSSDNPSINTTFYNGGLSPTTSTQSVWETINGITIRSFIGSDGHKICLANEETDIDAVYNATGEAWYYILDTTNQRFKLPRRHSQEIVRSVKNADGSWYRLYADGWVEQGGIIPKNTGTSGTITLSVEMANTNYTVVSNTGNNGANNFFNIDTQEGNITTTTMNWYKSSTSLVGSWQASGQSAIDMSSFQGGKKHLYFYMGLFTQTAIENTAGLNAEMFNDLNAHKVIDFQEPTSENNYTWYRLYADGWVEQGGYVAATTSSIASNAVSLPITMANSNYQVSKTTHMGASTTNSSEWGWWGDKPSSASANTTTTVYLSVANTSYCIGVYWEVKGMAA